MRHTGYKSSGLYKHQPRGYRFETQSYDLFQVIYVSAGKLLFSDSKCTKVLTSGYLAILRKGSTFTLSCPSGEYTGVGFHAIGDLPSQFVGHSEVLRSNGEIQTLARLIQKQFSHSGAEFALELEGLSLALGWEAIRLSEELGKMQSARSSTEWAAAAKAALDANIYNAATARSALAPLPLSYRQISRYFTDVFGISPKHYQLQAKIRAAETLLHETSLSVTMIAMELGFSSSQHFATQFKSVAGESPKSFRANGTE